MATTYTVRDVQERYGVSQGTVLHWLATGQLKAINVGLDPGKKRARYRISHAALEAFEHARQSTTQPATPSRRRRKKNSDPDFVEFFQ